MSDIRASVIIASYNRPERLARLVAGLAEQDTDRFEVIVVDDGSEPPSTIDPKFEGLVSRCIRQANGGPGSARDAGIRASGAEVIVLVDDDMVVPPAFVRSHLARHEAGADVVIGRFSVRNESPLHALQMRGLARYFAAAEEDESTIVASRLCTGNVSFRRDLYESVGGFDLSLRHSEDMELGIRFGVANARFGFAAGADTVHDDVELTAARSARASFEHGRSDVAIARRHPEIDAVNPWRMLDDLPLLARLPITALLQVPRALRPANVVLVGIGRLMLRLRVPFGTTAVFGLAHLLVYYAGVVEASGGGRQARAARRSRRAATHGSGHS